MKLNNYNIHVTKEDGTVLSTLKIVVIDEATLSPAQLDALYDDYSIEEVFTTREIKRTQCESPSIQTTVKREIALDLDLIS